VIGLSVGHRYRGGSDKGAFAADVEDPEFDQEAEIAEAYLNVAMERLVAVV
jgi:hypothetical protein